MNQRLSRRVIRTDGSVIELPKAQPIEQLRVAIGADLIDVVRLRHLGQPLLVMLVDDNGVARSLPVNQAATDLYLANCRPGTKHQIRGDVAVVPDSDFGGM